MSKKRIQVDYNWDAETGKATVTILDHSINATYVGEALCHPADEDMRSERTGLMLATYRAEKKALQAIRTNTLRPQLAILKQLYYSMSQSKQFNENSYENKMLQSQIHSIKNQIDIVNYKIDMLNKKLNDTIEEKEKFYKSVRELRKRKDKTSETTSAEI